MACNVKKVGPIPRLLKKTVTPFKNSVVIGHWRKNAKVTAIKQQQKSK
jgi:hypothetical protein